MTPLMKRSSEGRAVRRWTFPAALVLVALVAGVATSAYALWSSGVTNGGLVVSGPPKVGFALSRIGGAPTVATSGGSVLGLDITSEDANALVKSADGTLAIPFKVMQRADGNIGLTYSLQAPTFAAGTLFDAATMRVFPLTGVTGDAAATTSCRASAAPAQQPNLTNLIGLEKGSSAVSSSTAYWCLTYVRSETKGKYTNTAKAEATSGPASGTATWSAYVFEPGRLNATHQVVLP